MSLKKDTDYAFISCHSHLAIPLEHLHILKNCALVDREWGQESGRRWKLNKSELELTAVSAETITSLIAQDRLES